MKITIRIILILFMTLNGLTAQMKFIEDPAQGTLTLVDGQTPVLTYCFGDQLRQRLNQKYTRSCYIHPLYSLDGLVLTEDFPRDHPHHHGVFWTWPIVKTRGFHAQTWHPDKPSLRQHFVSWLKRETIDRSAVLSAEVQWKLDGQEIAAEEITTIIVHSSDKTGRAIDLELNIKAVGGPLELQGQPTQKKGYGGLCLRGEKSFKGSELTTDQGKLKKDVTNVPFKWADMSTEKLGVAIFVSPDHPDFPTTWLIRNSYAGILNPSWPGLKPAVIREGESVTLKYRLYIHRGDIDTGRVKKAYEEYLSLKQTSH